MNQKMPITPRNLPLISAVVVTYQPDAALLENLRGLLSQVPAVIVVDNGSSGAAAEVVEAAAKLAGVQLIRNGSNLGIATALNVGIRHALQAGSQWVATFDQDSSIPERFFEELFRAYNACPAPAKIGMIAPGKCSARVASRTKLAESENPSFSFVMAAITSGSLTKAEVFPATGLYDDGLFIDFVDVDFCLRMKKEGFKILSAKAVALFHELGTQQTRHLPGFQISFRVHAAWRHYYIMRNRILLYRRYIGTFPLWVLCDAVFIFYDFGKMTCLESGTAAKLYCSFRGIWDGIRCKTGRHADFPK